MVKRKVIAKSFEDLIKKKNKGQKGSFIQYEQLKMATYLLSKSNISVGKKA